MKRGLIVTTAICLFVSCLLVASPTPGQGTELTVSGNRDMGITVTQARIPGVPVTLQFAGLPERPGKGHKRQAKWDTCRRGASGP